MSDYRCHAVRRVNPFLGVTQVVETDDGRALSVDGVNWEIQLRVELPPSWGVLNRRAAETSYCRHAVWSGPEGLACLPPAPHLDQRMAARVTPHLIDAVTAAQAKLPFTLVDHLESWLLDATSGKPLALLHSQPPGTALPSRVARRWAPALKGDPALNEDGLASLAAWVARQALPTPCWIERGVAGEGRALDERGGSASETYATADFPELLLNVSVMQDAAATEPVDAYLTRLAPRLLMLPLHTATRERLEALAMRQPDEVARFFRLYPAVCDAARLNAARVQARLIAAA